MVNEDKKPRQFSISKVTAEDGSLVGWTVDIFEDNDMEKVVSIHLLQKKIKNRKRRRGIT